MKYFRTTIGICLALTISAFTTSFANAAADVADYIYTNANVRTMSDAQPRAEAVAIKDNKIVFVGSAVEAKAFAGPKTQVTDLKGQTVLPGFVSTHDHLIASQWTTLGVQLYDATDKADALAKIKAYAEANPNNKVITGIGWDKNMLEGLPVATDLDKAVADRPAIILDNTIHDAWLNTAALKAANITKDTKDAVPGVTYWERDEEGNPTGAAIEIQWFQAYIDMGAWDPDSMIPESAEYLLNLAASNGTTLVLVPGIITPNIKDVHGGMERDFETAMDILQDWANKDKLPLRVQAQPFFKTPVGDPQRFVDFGERMSKKFNSDLLRTRSLKIHPEGNTVAGTAPFIDPYKNQPDHRGAFNVQPETTMAIVTKAAKVGLDVFIHTDGDRSSRAAVDAILAARKIDADNRSALHHAIWVHPDDQKRIIDNKIPINSTPSFTNTFGGGKLDNERMIGYPRIDTSLGRYAHFARNGVKVGISADVPSTSPEMQGPLFVLDGATTGLDISTPDNKEVFPPNWKPMTVHEAMRAITIDAAWMLKMDDKVGSLEVGKYADLVVLASDPYEAKLGTAHQIPVLKTIMNGRITHQAK
ncbi:amidohydrolase [Paraferrimonas sedimenticola]|uniref:Amidohydrolase n=1 Tax=Paraferrimonas sedimenticola TaxID=375674 RepID=A0AA37W0J7_9GAMM|nr:amidohydrolase family protein [Paraferrimonas sedimenticola]GLP96400.1 amidohydrolase [Paraferrimonas sedimenticola]